MESQNDVEKSEINEYVKNRTALFDICMMYINKYRMRNVCMQHLRNEKEISEIGLR